MNSHRPYLADAGVPSEEPSQGCRIKISRWKHLPRYCHSYETWGRNSWRNLSSRESTYSYTSHM